MSTPQEPCWYCNDEPVVSDCCPMPCPACADRARIRELEEMHRRNVQFLVIYLASLLDSIEKARCKVSCDWEGSQLTGPELKGAILERFKWALTDDRK